MQSRVWAEIDQAAIRGNLSAIRRYVGLRTQVMAVVKANAYGHGIVEVVRAASEAGIEWFGVATVDEGIVVRRVAPTSNIVLLSPMSPDAAGEILDRRLIPLISDLEQARAISTVAHRMRGGAQIHLEVDTGMGRSGVPADQAEAVAAILGRMSSILLRGVATHFSAAEDDPDFTQRQIQCFQQVAMGVDWVGVAIDHVHAANSAALMRFPESRFNMVRPGLLVYGIVPPVPDDVERPHVRPVLTLKSRIALTRKVPPETPVSYGHTFVTQRPSTLATIPVGYGDGYPRALGNRGRVLIGGKFAPIVGRVCMDVLVADITDIPEAAAGDTVVLIGQQGDNCIRVEEIAQLAGTTEHDITTRLTERVPRIPAATPSSVK